jgi:hypothetical protein
MRCEMSITGGLPLDGAAGAGKRADSSGSAFYGMRAESQ